MKFNFFTGIDLRDRLQIVKYTMELEGLLFLTCKCCKGENTEIAAINRKTPMTDCRKEMLDDLERQVPERFRCHGLIASRVVAKGGDGGEMYFISPIKTKRWKAYIDAATYLGYTKNCKGVSKKMVKEHATEFGNNMMRMYGWEEPTQHPPTRMCDVD